MPPTLKKEGKRMRGRISVTVAGHCAWAVFWPGHNGKGYEPDEPAEMRIEVITRDGLQISEDDVDGEVLAEIYAGLWSQIRYRPEKIYHGNNDNYLDAIGRGLQPIFD